MGGQPGRGAALTPELAATLARVADALAVARRPWWVIGSAAVVLHGGATEVRDVDVVVDAEDVERIVAVGARPVEMADDPLFRSDRFLRWEGAPLVVEFMAGFHVASGGEWRPVEPRTRERVVVGRGAVFVPSRAELRAMLVEFGRPKDLVRAELLP